MTVDDMVARALGAADDIHERGFDRSAKPIELAEELATTRSIELLDTEALRIEQAEIEPAQRRQG